MGGLKLDAFKVGHTLRARCSAHSEFPSEELMSFIY
jgi:hypothetical protein